jgi:hypothetical protein
LSIVAGVDFGTLSVRVSLFSKSEGRLGTGVAEYPLHRSAQDPNFATQSHRAQMDALERAMRSALRESGVSGDQVRSLALDARRRHSPERLNPRIDLMCRRCSPNSRSVPPVDLRSRESEICEPFSTPMK